MGHGVNIIPFLRAVIHWSDLMTGILIEAYDKMSPHDRAHLRLRLKELKEAERQIEYELGADDDGPEEAETHGGA